MARFLCWHIQEQAFGGLDPDTAKLLEGFARGGRPGADAPRRLKPGTVLVREYQGERHTVTVVPGGYVWREVTYASLSTIARAITGTAWSGPRFFGLRACVNRLAEIEGDQTGFRRVRARADPRAYRGRPESDRFADHKEKVIDLLKRVTRVSVETMKIVEAMRQASHRRPTAVSFRRSPPPSRC